MEPFQIKSPCVWCGRETVESFPRKETDTAMVRRTDNDHVICHSCVKHLAVIVLSQENRIEREAWQAVQHGVQSDVPSCESPAIIEQPSSTDVARG